MIDRLNSTGVSIVLPVYNEKNAITATITELQKILENLNYPYEIIAVNDGSTDGTEELLQSFSTIRLINHRRNRGYGAALKTGIRQAKYNLVAITDADGTYPNERLPELISLARSVDMVVGARIGKDVKYSRLRKIPKYFLVSFAQWLAKQPIPDLNSGMRVFYKPTVEKFFHILPDQFSFTTTITLAMLTNNYLVHYEPVNYYHRVGKSKIKPIRDTLNFIQLILRTGVYFAPLRVFLPVAGIFYGGFFFSLYYDIFVEANLTDSTLILFVAATQITIFALLADMLDKRIK